MYILLYIFSTLLIPIILPFIVLILSIFNKIKITLLIENQLLNNFNFSTFGYNQLKIEIMFKNLALFCLLVVSTTAMAQTVNVQNNTCTDMEVTVYFDDVNANCRPTPVSCSAAYGSVTQTIPSGGNANFTSPTCSHASAYQVRSLETSGGADSMWYRSGCGTNYCGNYNGACPGTSFCVQGSSPFFEIN